MNVLLIKVVTKSIEIVEEMYCNKVMRNQKIKIPIKIGIYISAYSSLEKDILSLAYRTTYICEIDVKVM
ncbi:TPA: hypothetical protein ACR3Z0_002710 [Bacillus thuringiensis]|jgi:hypothetical protein|uniref:Uncharacterized protein n=7 Tax=Bacillus cereus group TaxID=86661 RepID=A0A9Q5QNQ3_BACCE|nr:MULTISPECIES: hypothetical protein [Bacillus]AHZ50881.1 hypothetical protein YBT1520_10825 [Bacillus thuringiensis serovar kurstaki str. YBT-1520]AIE33282.1 hypothetical protein BTK_10965 [Bacillus thuringiensis serovar kurstaki str. HD-1]AJA19400.1 hypothetical protein BT4G5_11075 [Bacillus thuringiensis serovar galleriae]ANN32086.1 hypothetical protein A9498_10595 [Bacillus thuringiensis serovar coreanensis]EEL29165.1 hypothetical protein bcere0018_17580 [Bacillus cereus Rock1-15]EHL7444